MNGSDEMLNLSVINSQCDRFLQVVNNDSQHHFWSSQRVDYIFKVSFIWHLNAFAAITIMYTELQ